MKQWTLEEEIKMVKWNPNGEDCVHPPVRRHPHAFLGSM